jgi:hypothetical protein
MIYLAWLAISILSLWPLADWSAQKRRPIALVVCVVMIAGCMAMLVAVAHLAPPRLRPPWQRDLEPLLLLLYLSPLSFCVATAQAAVRLGLSSETAWAISWTCGMVLVFLSPFLALFVGCSVAGACI